MSNNPPDSALMTKEEDASPSSVDSDHLRENTNGQKPDAKDSRPQRTSAGNRRRRRVQEEDQKLADRNTNGKDSQKEKEPKPRGNRRSAAASMSSSNSRKKPKLESPETPPNGVSSTPTAMGVAGARSPQITASPSGSTFPSFDPHQQLHSPLPPAVQHLHQPQPQQQQQQQQPTFSPYSSLPPPSLSYPTAQSYHTSGTQSQSSQPPPQRTSGQNYDPIRSAFDTSSPAPTPSAASPPAHNPSPRHAFRASASPAINSLIDPPPHNSQSFYSPAPHASPNHNLSNLSSPAGPAVTQTPTHHQPGTPSMPAASFSHSATPGPQQQLPSALQRPPQPPHSYPQHPYQGLPPEQQQQQQQPPPEDQGPQHGFSKPAQPMQTQQQWPEQPAQSKSQPVSPHQASIATDVDADKAPQSSVTKSSGVSKKEKPSTAASVSAAPSPQPARTTKEPHSLPQGSGLISNALFGKGDSIEPAEASGTTPNIILHVPLQGSGNKIINFARLAEEQYGFAALHPRLAAHQERLARVAAAGAALEKNEKGAKGTEAESADEDLSLDVDRDSELDGDVAMGGTGSGVAASANGTAGAEANEGKKRRRRKKVEEYDRDDPFVDDSELVWQEQAAASKDGFFVYSGPLVPEGEKVQVERADGTIKRGRGRGRGGRARGSSTHQQVHLAAAPVSQETGLPLRGPGSRGGTSRRARGSKARQQGDHDKQNHDRNGTTAPVSHEGRGRGSGISRGGGSAGRGGKAPSMAELAPAPKPNLAPAPPGPSPLAGPELVMKQ